MTRVLAGIVLAATLATSALAQPYPNRPVRLIVPFPPGGAVDLTARVVGQALTERIGQPVVVEARPGSNGNIAADYVAKSAANGYTILFGSDSIIAINPHLYPKLGYDPFKSFTPIALLAVNQLYLAVNPSLPVHTFAEFLAYARKSDPPLPYASIGNGSQHHLAMELLKQRAGINLVHVPYKGGGPAANALIAGETAAMFAGASIVPFLKSGRLRGLATSGAKRGESFPDLPTVGEFYPGYEVPIWLALFAPAGTPDDIVARLRNETNAVLAQPEVKDRLNTAGGVQATVATLEHFSVLLQ